MAFSTDNSFILSTVANEEVLDKAVHSSVSATVDALNAGTIPAPNGYVVVYSASQERHFMLYTNDSKGEAFKHFAISDADEAAQSTGICG